MRSVVYEKPMKEELYRESRVADIVRYEARSDGVYYWIKYPEELGAIQNSLKRFVQRVQQGLSNDT